MKRIARNLIRAIGYDVHRIQPSGPWLLERKDPFQDQGFLLRGRETVTVLDVGAHHGESIEKYKRIFPNSRVFSFEPFPESCEIVRMRYGGDQSVMVINKAVSRECGTGEFYVNQVSATNSLLPRPASGRRYYPKGATTVTRMQVPITTIDNFCAEQALKRGDILKLDIQGGELRALQGASEMLGQRRIELIYTEVFFVPHYEGAALFHELCAYLAGYDYTLYDIYEGVHARNGQLRYANALFVSTHVRAEVIDAQVQEE